MVVAGGALYSHENSRALYAIVQKQFAHRKKKGMANKYGIKELASGHKTNVDIVFVHGLFGHRENTWTGRQNKDILWPRDLLPADVPNARILTFGYDADVVKRGSDAQVAMESYAADLCDALARLRSGTDSVRNLLFNELKDEMKWRVCELIKTIFFRLSVRSYLLPTA